MKIQPFQYVLAPKYLLFWWHFILSAAIPSDHLYSTISRVKNTFQFLLVPSGSDWKRRSLRLEPGQWRQRAVLEKSTEESPEQTNKGRCLHWHCPALYFPGVWELSRREFWKGGWQPFLRLKIRQQTKVKLRSAWHPSEEMDLKTDMILYLKQQLFNYFPSHWRAAYL